MKFSQAPKRKRSKNQKTKDPKVAANTFQDLGKTPPLMN